MTPKVSLISAVSEAEQHQMEEKLERKIAPPVVKFEKRIPLRPSRWRAGPDRQAGDHLPRQNVHPKTSPLKDLGGEGGKCTIWGDVFFTEVKGNYRKIYTVSITDYTGSINLKIRAQEGEDCSKWESIGKGTTVIVRGDCSYDKYEHDYIVYPTMCCSWSAKAGGQRPGQASGAAPAHQTVQHGRLLRPRRHRAAGPPHGAPGHCHHRPRRVSGLPEAMLAADDIHKKDPDFKLIYGCEAYFVDDMIPCVYGVQEQP